MNRVEKRRSRRDNKMTISTAILLLVLLFCLYSSVMVFQRSYIYTLNNEIRALETEYELALKKNDDLQAKLMQSTSLQNIEQYATDVLGMVKPQSSYISYVSYGSSTQAVSNEYSDNSIVAWINSLFN